MSEKRASSSVLLSHAVGLHARPSVKLTKLAKTFASRIEFATTEKGPWIDAKSIVKVMAAKAPKDTIIYFRAEGDDAEQSVNALVALVARDFDELPGAPEEPAHADAS